MKTPSAAFRHSKRSCLWCAASFRPTETLSPVSTERFCSTECAYANRLARDTGTYEVQRETARMKRAEERSAIGERLREGRERSRRERS